MGDATDNLKEHLKKYHKKYSRRQLSYEKIYTALGCVCVTLPKEQEMLCVLEWVRENITHETRFIKDTTLVFKNKDDATLFKLRWL